VAAVQRSCASINHAHADACLVPRPTHRLLELPSGRLLQRWPGAVLGDADRVACMYAFVTLVFGLLLPLLLLYVKEVHFRGGWWW
jgi:hypothetical protein